METDIEPPFEATHSFYTGAGVMFGDGKGGWEYFPTHTIQYFDRKLDESIDAFNKKKFWRKVKYREVRRVRKLEKNLAVINGKLGNAGVTRSKKKVLDQEKKPLEEELKKHEGYLLRASTKYDEWRVADREIMAWLRKEARGENEENMEPSDDEAGNDEGNGDGN